MSHTYAGADAYPGSVTLPDDLDPADAASVNVALEGLADRTTWLAQRIGAMYLVGIYENGSSTGATVHSWHGTSYTDGAPAGQLSIACVAGDVLVVSSSWDVSIDPGGATTLGSLRIAIDDGTAGAYVEVPHSVRNTQEIPIATAPPVVACLAMGGKYTIVHTDTHVVSVQGALSDATAGNALDQNAGSIIAHLYRAP